MARQNSISEVAGHLGASLTPRVLRLAPPPRVTQSSGFIDVNALYSAALGEVGRRSQNAAFLAPPARARPVPWPSQWPQAPEPYRDACAEVPIGLSRPLEVRQSRGLGWFGVAVAWLATVTLSALLATTVPAHASLRSTARPFVARAVAAPAPLPATAAPVPGVNSDWTAVPQVAPAWVVPLGAGEAHTATAAAEGRELAPARRAMAVPPGTNVPSTSTEAARPRVTLAQPVLSPSASPKRARVRPSMVPREAAVVHPEPAPSGAVHDLAAASAAARAAPPVATSTAGMSLDDLIRHEVQAESAKKGR